MSLYEDLGVAKDATQEIIKKAFRKKALKVHPDVNHSEDSGKEFRSISIAYRILSDEEKRRRYDNGENPDMIDKDNSSMHEQEVLSMILGLFTQIVEFIPDVDNNDIFIIMRRYIQDNQNKISSEKEKYRNQIKKYEKTIKRIKKKGKHEVFTNLLKFKIEEVNKNIMMLDRTAKLSNDGLEFIKDCECEVEHVKPTMQAVKIGRQVQYINIENIFNKKT